MDKKIKQRYLTFGYEKDEIFYDHKTSYTNTLQYYIDKLEYLKKKYNGGHYNVDLHFDGIESVDDGELYIDNIYIGLFEEVEESDEEYNQRLLFEEEYERIEKLKRLEEFKKLYKEFIDHIPKDQLDELKNG